jgi:hypothetical protein
MEEVRTIAFFGDTQVFLANKEVIAKVQEFRWL